METRITVDLVLVDGKSPLRALADVILRWTDGEMTLRRFAVFQKPDQPPWASVPRLRVERNGRKAYVPLLELPRDIKRRVLEAVLEEYRRLCDAQ